jgi:Tfp pilus assembly protein PilX
MHRRVLAIMNDRGSALVIGLLTLALLSLLGSASTTTSRTEIQIAGNDKAYKEAFYTAEVGLTTGEMVVEKLLNRTDLAEQDTAGHYGEAGSEDPQPGWRALAWDDTDSVKVATDDIPSGLANHGALARYTIAQRNFIRDSLTTGIGVPTGRYNFNITGLGTSTSKHAAETVLQTIYAKRYD